MLYTAGDPDFPELDLQIIPDYLVPGGYNHVKMTVTNNRGFKISQDRIKYVSHPHIGFNIGDLKSATMSFTDDTWSYLGNFYIPPDAKLSTFGAGFSIEYGEFRRVIAQEKIIMCGDWADPIAARELVSHVDSSKDNLKSESTDFILCQNYPNPFNPVTNIEFMLPEDTFIILTIYDLNGKKVKGLKGQEMNAGPHSFQFDGSDLASGTYFFELIAGNYRKVRKMLLLK